MLLYRIRTGSSLITMRFLGRIGAGRRWLVMNRSSIRPFIVEVPGSDEVRVAALAATGPIMPWAPFFLMVTAALTKFAVARVAVTCRGLQMPVAAFGQFILRFIQLIHFFRMGIARSFVVGAIISILVDAPFYFAFLSLGSGAVFGGTIANLVPDSIELGFIHSVFVLLLRRAG